MKYSPEAYLLDKQSIPPENKQHENSAYKQKRLLSKKYFLFPTYLDIFTNSHLKLCQGCLIRLVNLDALKCTEMSSS